MLARRVGSVSAGRAKLECQNSHNPAFSAGFARTFPRSDHAHPELAIRAPDRQPCVRPDEPGPTLRAVRPTRRPPARPPAPGCRAVPEPCEGGGGLHTDRPGPAASGAVPRPLDPRPVPAVGCHAHLIPPGAAAPTSASTARRRGWGSVGHAATTAASSGSSDFSLRSGRGYARRYAQNRRASQRVCRICGCLAVRSDLVLFG